MTSRLFSVRDAIHPENAARLVAWMRFVMEERGIDQRELAKGLKVDEGYVSKIFKGERQPGWKVFMGLHQHFKVRLEQLVYMHPTEVSGVRKRADRA